MALYYLKKLGAPKGCGITPCNKSKVVIGRNRDCDIVLFDLSISRNHAEIRQESDNWIILSNGPSGVKIDQIVLPEGQQTFLLPGSFLQIGDTTSHTYFFGKKDTAHDGSELDNENPAYPLDNRLNLGSNPVSSASSTNQRNASQKNLEEAEESLYILRKAPPGLDPQLKLSLKLNAVDSLTEIEEHHQRRLLERERIHSLALENMTEKSNELQYTIQNVRRECDEKKEQLAALRNRLKQKEYFLEFYTEEIEDRQRDMEGLRDLRDTLSGQLEELCTERKQLLSRLKLASEQNSDLEERLQNSLTSSQASNMEQKYSSLMAEKESLEQATSAAIQAKDKIISDVANVIDDELQCIVCNEAIIKAVVLNCSHSFCEFCIQRWKKTKNECPTCRTNITSEVRCISMDNLIDRLMSTLSDDHKAKRIQIIVEREGEVASARRTEAVAQENEVEVVEGPVRRRRQNRNRRRHAQNLRDYRRAQVDFPWIPMELVYQQVARPFYDVSARPLRDVVFL